MLRSAAASAIAVGLSYPVIIALFVVAGPVLPIGQGADIWLRYFAGKQSAWWAIVGLSAVTDVLWIPVAWALHRVLETVDKALALWGAGLMVLFVFLELAVSWPAFAVLVGLSEALASAEDAERAPILAAAGFAAALQSSHLLPLYAILVPGAGKLALGGAMLRGGPFGRTVAILAIVIGVLSVVSAVGRIAWAPVGAVIVPASVLSAAWFVLVGRKLVTLARSVERD